MTPLASATVASTNGFIPRRRTGREVIERTSTSTVAVSSGCRSAIVIASPEPRGRWPSRSPTVTSPIDSAASAAVAGSTPSGASRADGRGQRRGASSSSDGSRSRAVANAVGTTRMMNGAAAAALFGGHQPPPARLPAEGALQLYAVGRQRGDGVVVQRGAVARDARHELGAVAQAREHLAQRRLRLAPRDDVGADEADRLADSEAALGVLPRR